MASLVLLVALAFLTACASGDAGEHRAEQGPRVPVKVARAVARDAPVELGAIGTVQAFSTVSVKAQVEGQLAQVAFVEGQEVRQGDLLFAIDSRPFAAALRQAEASLARDRAQAENARIEAGRLSRLLGSGVVSKDEYDRARTQADAAQAAVAAAEAAAERGRIDLGYCEIRSPIDGRIGRILVHEGNAVKERDTTLAVINQVRPIYVQFAVAQQALPVVRQHAATGPLPVRAILPVDGNGNIDGELVFIDNGVDPATGTVLLKGRFANTNEELWPGQFVDVVLRLTTEHDVIVVPSSAVQTGQQGKYVFVVRDDGTVESRPVETGASFEQQVVVRDGLAAGQVVVTEGQLRLAPGVRVEVKDGAG